MSTVKCNLPMRNQDQPRSEEDEAAPPSPPPKTMEDLPPELVTKILEFVTLDGNKKNMLNCRLVNSQWNEIMDPVIENGICSRQFEAFPEMRMEHVDIDDVDGDGHLQVSVCPTRFPHGSNPFPFNSLQLWGPTSRFDPDDSHVPLLSLSAFASRFGGNLTTFTLTSVCLHAFNTLPVMLRSMPNLKRLSLQYVRLVIDVESLIDIPTAPHLPNLTIMELRSPLGSFVGEKILFLWLAGSYADQLEFLRLNTFSQLPALEAGCRYSYPLDSGEELTIVTTSENAFRNLKELSVLHPSARFLVLSDTPALQRFVIKEDETYLASTFDLSAVDFLIYYCSSTLESLNLNFLWNGMDDEEDFRFFLDNRRSLYVGAEEVGFPRLKTVFIQYPSTDFQESMLSTFLTKFTALKTLHFLRFRVHHFDSEVKVDQKQLGNGNNENGEGIATFKVQLAQLYQRMCGIQNDTKTALSAKMALLIDLPEDEQLRREIAAQVRQLDAEMGRLDDALNVARNERAEIYNRLAALGENIKEVMVEQLLERGGFWNTFPNLRTVSVSSGHRPVGDVCVARRMEDA